MTKEIILDRAFEFVREYERQFNTPVSMRLLAQKFGKQITKFDEDLSSFFKSDLRFFVTLSKTGGYMVSSVERLGPNALVIQIVKREGGSLPLEELRKQFDERETEENLDDVVFKMENAGALIVEDEIVMLARGG